MATSRRTILSCTGGWSPEPVIKKRENGVCAEAARGASVSPKTWKSRSQGRACSSAAAGMDDQLHPHLTVRSCLPHQALVGVAKCTGEDGVEQLHAVVVGAELVFALEQSLAVEAHLSLGQWLALVP